MKQIFLFPPTPFIDSHDRGCGRIAETKKPHEPYIGGSIRGQAGGRTSGGGGELTVASTTDCQPTKSLVAVQFQYRSRTRDFRRLHQSPLPIRWKKKISRGQNRLTARTHTRRIRPRTDSRAPAHARTHARSPAGRLRALRVRIYGVCLSGRRKRSASRSDLFLSTTNVFSIGISSRLLIQRSKWWEMSNIAISHGNGTE